MATTGEVASFPGFPAFLAAEKAGKPGDEAIESAHTKCHTEFSDTEIECSFVLQQPNVGKHNIL